MGELEEEEASLLSFMYRTDPAQRIHPINQQKISKTIFTPKNHPENKILFSIKFIRENKIH